MSSFSCKKYPQIDYELTNSNSCLRSQTPYRSKYLCENHIGRFIAGTREELFF